MSATLRPEWLRSVDTEPRYDNWLSDPSTIPAGQLDTCPGARGKTLSTTIIAASDAKELARCALDQHAKVPDGAHGRITLVITNTVQRACETFDALRSIAPGQQLELVHSRFRPTERSEWRRGFLSREACIPGADRIIVATQVVEAGVDISAGCVVTELAPWPSLVQRFGRCARYGGRGTCLVVDRGREETTARPYEPAELEPAWAALEKLNALTGDVGSAHLEAFEADLDEAGRKALFPYDPRHLLLRRELDELFDTTPDLTGADLDISRFIRTGDERDLHVFWRDIPKPTKAEPRPQPPRRVRAQRSELCPIPFLAARDWLCGAETKANRKPRLRSDMRAWVWDWVDGEWGVADRSMLTPGRVVLVAADCGGYQVERGFAPESDETVQLVPLPDLPPTTEAELQASESEGADDLSAADWKTIACHGGEVAETARRIGAALGLRQGILDVLVLGGRWHDLGKAHPAFQGSIRRHDRPDRRDLAKAPENAWLKPPGNCRTADDRDRRPGLRHELASALALFAVLQRHQPLHPALLGPWVEAMRLTGSTLLTNSSSAEPTPCEREVLGCSADAFDLLAYLVACHHGKVRVALHAGPKDQDYRDLGDERGMPIRGVRDGDVLPSILIDASGPPLPSLTLTLEPASLGLSPRTGRSWRERTLDLVDRFGPGALAWLEALLIAADRRASRLKTVDPALARSESSR
jgi:CRISPR-associated endonuclease/helicase Cas3